MHIGGDFFRIAKFVILLMKLFGQIFGDDDDRVEAEITINGLDPKPNNSASKIPNKEPLVD